MAEDFRGPHLKLSRAEHHIIELRELVKAFSRKQLYEAIANRDIQPGYLTLIARQKEPFSHDEFSPIIGDVIHNLRDALDLAACVLMRNAGRSDQRVSFPTGETVDHFRQAIANAAKDKRPFPDPIVTILETRIQPYGGGRNGLLRTLHNLAVQDRHRLVVPVVLGFLRIELESQGQIFPLVNIDPRPKAIRDGSILAIIEDVELAELEINKAAEVTPTLAFDESSGRLWGEPLEDGCRKLLYATQEAVDALKDCL